MADGSSVEAVSGVAGVRTLLIDNYDSYTYNLHQLIAEVNGGNAMKPMGHLTIERKKERNPLQKGEAEDIIGPCGV